eukprot:scaffold30615_cov64-Phaeocystis_antarctica.AAC.10
MGGTGGVGGRPMAMADRALRTSGTAANLRAKNNDTRRFPRQKGKWVLPLLGVGIEDRAGAARLAPIGATPPFDPRQAAILDLEATTSEFCDKVSLVRCRTNESRAAKFPRIPHISLVRSQRERVRCVQRRPLRRIVKPSAAHWQPLASGQRLHLHQTASSAYGQAGAHGRASRHRRVSLGAQMNEARAAAVGRPHICLINVPVQRERHCDHLV